MKKMTTADWQTLRNDLTIEKSAYYTPSNPLDRDCTMGCLIDDDHTASQQRTTSFKTEDEAGVWTAELNKAHLMARALQAGSVFINNYNNGDMTVPCGDFKQSSNGNDKSFHSLDKFSELKTTWIDLNARVKARF